MSLPRSIFLRRLNDRNHDPEGRRWIFVPYDQLNDQIGALAKHDPAELGVVLVESKEKASRRPYHRQKLAYILANQRQFALEQAARGVAIDYRISSGGYAAALPQRPLQMMQAAEWELRHELAPLVQAGTLSVEPHEGWLTTSDQFVRSQPKRPWRMDAFYRLIRRESEILMERGQPVGGKFSFDAENRKPWKGEPAAAVPPTFQPDEITLEVGALIESEFEQHPGMLDLSALPATAADAATLLDWADTHCLPMFGPYEDAV